MLIRSIFLSLSLFLMIGSESVGDTYNCVVFTFQNYSDRPGIGAEITDKVSTYMCSNLRNADGSSYCIIIERDKISAIMAEQTLCMSGAVSEASAVKVGSLAGAQIVVIGFVYSCSINETNEFKEESKYEGQYAHRDVSIHIGCRLIDVATGQIMKTYDGQGTTSSEGFTTWRSKRQTKDFGDALWKAIADNWVQNITEPKSISLMIEETENIAVARMFGGN